MIEKKTVKDNVGISKGKPTKPEQNTYSTFIRYRRFMSSGMLCRVER
jgi:hypothetical protein